MGQLDYPKQNTLLTLDEIQNGAKSLRSILYSAYLTTSGNFGVDDAERLRHWLVEPEYSKEQRQPLFPMLDGRQRSLVESAPQKRFRKIRGSAGSGKSLVLAARAAFLNTHRKRILVVTFNITLANYLRDFGARGCRDLGRRNDIEYHNFHSWCKLLACITSQHLISHDPQPSL
jgi:hypothetical protein